MAAALAELISTVDLVIFSYVLVETAAVSRAGGWRLLRGLGARLPVGGYIVALDATHRVNPVNLRTLSLPH